jgi:hypothetical protein
MPLPAVPGRLSDPDATEAGNAAKPAAAAAAAAGDPGAAAAAVKHSGVVGLLLRGE